ncbi:putative membrane protein [Cyanobium sp. NS01]|nr:putative membrane protein [Cyanobium sp. NS01]
MDTERLLLAFLTFGAACTTLWAWMLANSGSNSSQSRQ